MDEFTADPVELARLAQTSLATSQTFGDASRAAQDAGTLLAPTFGNTANAAETEDFYRAVASEMGVAVGQLSGSFETDMGALLQAAFYYHGYDATAATAITTPGTDYSLMVD